MKTIWDDIKNTPIESAAIGDLFPSHKYKNNKISALEKKGELIRLKQGLYVPSPRMTGWRLSLELIANHLYGPSYVSMNTALRYYGLIPERVYRICSMTMKHSRTFTNSLATFEYVHADSTVFSIGIRCINEDDTYFLIASPEKALCDLIANISGLNLRYRKEIITWLEEDIRFDTDALADFDIEILKAYAKVGKKKNMINQLIKLIEK